MTLQEALECPAAEISDQLIRAFFEIMHAAYPVLDRTEFSRLYNQGAAPPQVLQTIYLLGFTVCSDELVREAGFSDRAVARRTYYRKAKTLYDADYDKDPLNIAAVLLLLGFWWAGYDEQKDVCHWVGCATTFAQSCGLHRAQPGLSPRAQSLRRRIWWAIYVRDLTLNECRPTLLTWPGDTSRLVTDTHLGHLVVLAVFETKIVMSSSCPMRTLISTMVIMTRSSYRDNKTTTLHMCNRWQD